MDRHSQEAVENGCGQCKAIWRIKNISLFIIMTLAFFVQYYRYSTYICVMQNIFGIFVFYTQNTQIHCCQSILDITKQCNVCIPTNTLVHIQNISLYTVTVKKQNKTKPKTKKPHCLHSFCCHSTLSTWQTIFFPGKAPDEITPSIVNPAMKSIDGIHHSKTEEFSYYAFMLKLGLIIVKLCDNCLTIRWVSVHFKCQF